MHGALWACEASSNRFQCAGTNSKQMKKQTTKAFTLGHSPDPDDAFMFYAIAKNKIDLRGYRFDHRLEDIQTLNERARHGELHISAISIHAYAYVADKYALLPCGASMGDGYGPVVVRKLETLNSDKSRAASNAERQTTSSMNETATRELLNGKQDRRAWRDDERVSGAAAFPGKIRLSCGAVR